MTASERIRAARVQTLAQMNLGQAEDGYASGTLSPVEYEAYRRAWSDAGAARLGYSGANGWTQPSDDPAVESLAADLVEFALSAR